MKNKTEVIIKNNDGKVVNKIEIKNRKNKEDYLSERAVERAKVRAWERLFKEYNID